MALSEIEAYPCGRSWLQRKVTEYQPGDRVLVGPGYRSDLRGYAHDGCAGLHVVVKRFKGSDDYALARPGNEDLPGLGYDVIVSASRLTLA